MKETETSKEDLQVLNQLIILSTQKFWEKDTYFDAHQNREYYFLIEDACRFAIVDYPMPPFETVPILMQQTRFKDPKAYGLDVDLYNYDSWEDFLIYLGKHILRMEIVSSDKEIEIEDSIRMDKEMNR